MCMARKNREAKRKRSSSGAWICGLSRSGFCRGNSFFRPRKFNAFLRASGQWSQRLRSDGVFRAAYCTYVGRGSSGIAASIRLLADLLSRGGHGDVGAAGRELHAHARRGDLLAPAEVPWTEKGQWLLAFEPATLPLPGRVFQMFSGVSLRSPSELKLAPPREQ